MGAWERQSPDWHLGTPISRLASSILRSKSANRQIGVPRNRKATRIGLAQSGRGYTRIARNRELRASTPLQYVVPASAGSFHFSHHSHTSHSDFPATVL